MINCRNLPILLEGRENAGYYNGIKQIDKDQKEQLVKEFTESASRIMNIPPETFIVYLKENELDNIGSGGKLLSNMPKK